jgi:acid stress-induced BolA-like protein IbaG/YrbA
MDIGRENIHALSAQTWDKTTTHLLRMHNTTRNITSMDIGRENIHALSAQTWDKTTTHKLHEEVHNMVSGTLGQWIGKEEIHAPFNTNIILKAWEKLQLTD